MSDSRWARELAQHPFQADWNALKTELGLLEVDDQTVATTVMELARLKRVVVFVDAILGNIDAELVPAKTWSNFQPQSEALLQQVRQYVANRNAGHLQNANAHADNLLAYVRPHMVIPPEAVDALRSSVATLSTELTRYVESFRDKSEVTLQQIEQDRVGTSSNLKASTKAKERIEQYAATLFESSGSAESIQKQLENLLQQTRAASSEIEEFQNRLLVGTPKEESTRAILKGAEAEIVSARDRIVTAVDGVEGEVRQLSSFHEKIFGKRDDVTSKHLGGLEQELDARTEQLRRLESEQKTKHATLFAEIESLLPGANSAGLASAYNKLKDEFQQPIKIYTNVFYGALCALVVTGLVAVVQRVSLWPLAIEFVEAPQWDAILRGLVYKAPLIVPVIWLALFASTRRSQYERLQQEYAHKEALARSYESYKKQIQDLKDEAGELQKQLIASSINAISYNASRTLDGKHGDKLPAQQLLEKLSVDDVKKLVDDIKKLFDLGAKGKSGQ